MLKYRLRPTGKPVKMGTHATRTRSDMQHTYDCGLLAKGQAGRVCASAHFLPPFLGFIVSSPSDIISIFVSISFLRLYNDIFTYSSAVCPPRPHSLFCSPERLAVFTPPHALYSLCCAQVFPNQKHRQRFPASGVFVHSFIRHAIATQRRSSRLFIQSSALAISSGVVSFWFCSSPSTSFTGQAPKRSMT